MTLCAQIDPILNTFIAQTFQLLLVGKNGDTGAPAQSLAAEERRPGREVAIMLQRGLNRADDEDDGDVMRRMGMSMMRILTVRIPMM